MHRCVLLLATLAVLANATNIIWSPSIVRVTNTLPSPRNTSTYESTLSKISPLDPNFSWSSNVYGDCAGITISPSNGTSISAVTALVHVDWRVISAANTFDCYIEARTSTGRALY
jgi:hypothetical protein